MIVLAAFAAVAAVCWHIWVAPWNDPGYGLFHNGIDTRVYRGAAQAVWHDLPLYDAPVYRLWRFTYAPFAAVVMIPLSAFSAATALLLWNISSVISLLLLIGVSMHAMRFRVDLRLAVFTILTGVAVTTLEPVHTTLWNGQINLFLALAVVADLSLVSNRLRGVGVGLAAGIKLTPMFYVAYLVTVRKFRYAAVALTTFAATVVVGAVVLGSEATGFWTHDMLQTGRIGNLDAPANQTFRGYFARLATFDIAHPPSWLWIPVGFVVGVLGLWGAHAAYRSGANLLAISITGMTSCAIGPFSWGHHWVWIVPLLLVATVHAVDQARRDRPGTWLWWLAPASVVALTFAYTQWATVPLPGAPGKFIYAMQFGPFRGFIGSETRGWHYPVELISSGAYLIVLLGTVAVTLGWARRRRRPDGQPASSSVPATSKPTTLTSSNAT